MSKERELLWRIQQVLQGEHDDYGFPGEIEELLTQPDINTQYLLDQVARLTAENAMLKEKWLAPPKREPFGPEERQRLSKAYSTRAEQVAFEEGIIFAKILYSIGDE